MPRSDLLTPNVEAATLGAPGRPNQDRLLVLPHAVAVLDGATDPDEPQGRDGGWYADCLSDALRSTLTARRSLPDAVEEAIGAVARKHQLVPGRSPSSTVAVASWDEKHVHAYVLGDSTVAVVHGNGQSEAVTDRRLQLVGTDIRDSYRARLRNGTGYDDEHGALVRELVRAERTRRNHPDGYWIAEAQAEAAGHALTRSWDREDIAALVLATDGASAALTYRLSANWADALSQVEACGAERFLARVWDAEQSDADGSRWPRAKASDDKTIAVLRFGVGAANTPGPLGTPPLG